MKLLGLVADSKRVILLLLSVPKPNRSIPKPDNDRLRRAVPSLSLGGGSKAPCQKFAVSHTTDYTNLLHHLELC